MGGEQAGFEAVGVEDGGPGGLFAWGDEIDHHALVGEHRIGLLEVDEFRQAGAQWLAQRIVGTDLHGLLQTVEPELFKAIGTVHIGLVEERTFAALPQGVEVDVMALVQLVFSQALVPQRADHPWHMDLAPILLEFGIAGSRPAYQALDQLDTARAEIVALIDRRAFQIGDFHFRVAERMRSHQVGIVGCR